MDGLMILSLKIRINTDGEKEKRGKKGREKGKKEKKEEKKKRKGNQTVTAEQTIHHTKMTSFILLPSLLKREAQERAHSI